MRTLMNKKNQHGFTLVELMIVVAIIGILAVLAIYGVGRYMINAKTGEARNSLGQISKGATAAYDEERVPSETLALGKESAVALHALCGDAVKVPAAGIPQDKKYQSFNGSNKDWAEGDKDKGWPCLKFSLTEPQYFQYDYKLIPGATPGFAAVANADFKGAGAATHGFGIKGGVDNTTKQLVVSTALKEAEGAVPPDNSW